MSALTHSFRNDATSVLWTDHPVVIFQGVHGLKDGGHSTNVGVDVSVVDKLCCQVTVELRLHLSQKIHQIILTVFLSTKTSSIHIKLKQGKQTV